MKYKIATWNVNSFKVRYNQVLDIIKNQHIDMLLLQEVKGLNEDIFKQLLKDINFKSEYVLQKAYNGVATIFNEKIENKLKNNSNSLLKSDPQARYLELLYNNNIYIINVYIPNGNPIESEKYTYKITWLNALYNRLYDIINKEKKEIIIAGDFNIAPFIYDVYNPKSFANDAIFQKEIRDIYFKILNLGLTNYLELKNSLHNKHEMYTWWSYRTKGYWDNKGVRIDHILTSAKVSDNIIDSYTFKETYEVERPSDHCPIILEIDI